MAKEVIVRLRDDKDGSDAVETVEFGLAGIWYEIDLSEENAAALQDSIQDWVHYARRIETAAKPSRFTAPAKQKPKTDGQQQSAIREWAAKKGLAVSSRGRIRQEIVDQYNAEAGNPAA